MLSWQTLPPGGLGINRSPASFWVSVPPRGVNVKAGRSNKSARDCLTKSSRLVDFCSSSNSFYGLYSSMGLSSPYTHRCVDHPTDLCLIRSPTCSSEPLLPSQFTLFPFNILFICSYHPFIPSLLSLSTPSGDSLCVVGQKLLQTEGVLPLRVDRVPPAAGEVDPRVVLCQLGHVPSVCHHLEGRKSTTNTVQIFVSTVVSS